MAGSLVAALLLGGCGGGSSENTAASKGLPKEIVIGAAIAKSGYLAPYDTNISAIEQLVDETNANGGIDGHKVRIVQANNRSEPQEALIAARRVIEKGADALLLSCEALTASAAAPAAEEHNELNFTMCASEPGFGPPTTGRLSFTGNPSLMSESSAGATFLREKGLKHPFLFRDTSIIFGKADCSAFQQAWEHSGGKIAGSVDFKNEDASVASQIAALKASGADAIKMCSYPPGGASAIKQIRAAGIEIPIMTNSAFDGTYWIKGIPETGKIYISLNGSAYDPPNRRTAQLFERLERAGVETNVSGALLSAYSAGQLILDAIEETGSVDGKVLADDLERKPHETIIGKTTFTPDNHYPNRVAWPMYELSGGKPRLLVKVKPRFIPEYSE